jgi:hypothetical protein
MRLTTVQVYIIGRPHCGVYFSEMAKWDQRALRGLWERGLMRFDKNLGAYLTDTGEDAFQESHRAKLRKNPNAPLFGNRRLRNVVKMRKIA